MMFSPLSFITLFSETKKLVSYTTRKFTTNEGKDVVSNDQRALDRHTLRKLKPSASIYGVGVHVTTSS